VRRSRVFSRFTTAGLTLKQQDLHCSLMLFKCGLEFSHVVFLKRKGLFVATNLHFVILSSQASAS
jgi:hypothetical protein